MKKSEIEFGIEYGISGIYQIIFDDGKRKPLIYIGESKCIKTRWAEGHIYCIENDKYKRVLECGKLQRKYIQNVYNKHGWEHFEFKVFEVMDGSTEQERFSREIELIAEFKTNINSKTYDGYGFNHDDGGKGFSCGADHVDAKPCEVEGVRYSWYGEVAEVYGISGEVVSKRIKSTSLRFKNWLGLDENGNVIPKECIPTKYDEREDKYILEYKLKGEHVGWKVNIPFVGGNHKGIGYFEMNEKELAIVYRDYWLEHPNKSGFVDVVGEHLKEIFYNENIGLKPSLDLTKGYSFREKENKYLSIITINKKQYGLGLYTAPQEASKMHYFALYNYVLNGTLPLKGKDQYKLYLETKEKGSEHPIINHLFES